VPTGGSRHLVDQEQRLGKVTDVDDVPELVPHLVRASCTSDRSRMKKRSCSQPQRIKIEAVADEA
jgi:hypothetical protein